MPKIICIRGWSKFQHYKDRDPPWIKLYRDMLTAESWVLGTDASRLVQIACTLLAARYHNATPLNFDLFRKVASLDMNERTFLSALAHLESNLFLDIQEDEDASKQPASTVLAKCSSEAEQSRAEAEQRVPSEPCPAERDDDPVARVFDHWRTTHGHPRSSLDAKRRKLIRDRLKDYAEADLCQSISGYLNSPHHMGQNPKATKYDDIELMLRDAKHVDAGIAFYRTPPSKLSALTRRNVAATEDWVPPEIRHATA